MKKAITTAIASLIMALVCATTTYAQDDTICALNDTIGDAIIEIGLDDSAYSANAHKSFMGVVDNFMENTIEGAFVTAIVAIVATVVGIILVIFLVYRGKRNSQQANNDLILEISRSGQQITPELIESIRGEKKHDDKVKDASPLATGFKKFYLGIGLIIVSIVLLFINLHKFFFIGMPMLIYGIFSFAQGLAGIIAFRYDEKKNKESDKADKTETL